MRQILKEVDDMTALFLILTTVLAVMMIALLVVDYLSEEQAGIKAHVEDRYALKHRSKDQRR